MNKATTKADERFCNAIASLGISASINTEAVKACFAWNDHDRSYDSAAMLADSLALGLRQIHHLNCEMRIWALDYEMAAAYERV